MTTHTMLPAMQLALDANFGGVAQWQAAFEALPGARLLFNPKLGQLQNIAGSSALPIAAVVLHEGPAAPDWATVYERYQQAVHAASDGCAASQAQAAHCTVIDVRRAAMFAQATTTLPGATWRDPAQVGAWAHELRDVPEVVVYCIYGHEVGRATALRLRAEGVNAKYLAGGIDEWTQAGLPLQAKADSA
jgi:superoxide dismutase, Fe-Mn family